MSVSRPAMAKPVTIASLTSLLCGDSEFPHGIEIALGDTRVGVRSNSPELVDSLADYFRPFLACPGCPHVVVTALESPALVLEVPLVEKEPDPGKTRVKEEYARLDDGLLVRKRLTGMVFLMGAGENLAVGPCLANVNQVVNFINSRYIEVLLRRGGLLCHASAVTRGNQGVVIAGRPGAGKSTAALRLMERGFDFVSNDRLVLQHERGRIRVRGVPKLPRVNPGTILGQKRLWALMGELELAESRALPSTELWSLERKYDVPLERLFGPDRFRLDTELSALVILEWSREGGGCIVEPFAPNQRPDLLGPLVKAPGLFFMPEATEAPVSPPDPVSYGAMAAGRPAFRLSGGVDFDALATLCLQIVCHEERKAPEPRETHVEGGRRHGT